MRQRIWKMAEVKAAYSPKMMRPKVRELAVASFYHGDLSGIESSETKPLRIGAYAPARRLPDSKKAGPDYEARMPRDEADQAT